MRNYEQYYEHQERILRRSNRFQRASSLLAEINADSARYSQELVDRVTSEYRKSKAALDQAEAHFENYLANTSEKIIEIPDSIAVASAGIVVTAGSQLLEYLARYPEHLHSLHWRAFEELIATIFSDLGYEVELMPATHDGGKDIIVRAYGDVGPFMTYIECKHYSPFHPVDVKTIRALYGVQLADHANKSMVVTTSTFTKDAVEFARGLSWMISLKDYDGVADWLKRYK